jgi:NADP-dependent 3-hydroxy acid dehydrogenase YdfG
MTSFVGRKAIVTGASSGIGAAIASAFAVEGAAVALLARRKDRLDDVADTIHRQGGTAHPVPVDLADADAASAATRSAIDLLDGVDLVVNAAGIMHLGRFASQSPGEWREMMDLNVTALLTVTQIALLSMVEGARGDIVNISSVSGRSAAALFAVYSATKFAVHGFTESLRQELAGTDIRVLTVEPGATRTEIGQHIRDPEVGAFFAREMKGVAVMSAEDVARAVVFAVSQPPDVAINDIVVRPTRQAF